MMILLDMICDACIDRRYTLSEAGSLRPGGQQVGRLVAAALLP